MFLARALDEAMPRFGMRLTMASLTVAVTTLGAEPANTLESAAIISRSIEANEADWVADPLYDRCERDNSGDDVQTFDVTMMNGRPYARLVALDDQPLSPSQVHDEQDKRRREIARRTVEDA